MREGQWKELVDQEHYFGDKWAVAAQTKAESKLQNELDADSALSLPSLPPSPHASKVHLPYFQEAVPSLLYDIGNTKEGNITLLL